MKGVLGTGGMGVVLSAANTSINLPVAVKLLHGNLVTDGNTVQRFEREAKAAAGTGHQHIVEIYDMGTTEEGTPFIVMELLEGENLQKILKRERVLDFDRAGRICIQVLSALSAVHAQGIVHRDLKPANVILIERAGKNDFVKLVDFGISKFHEDGRNTAGLTATGMVLGTPHYMSLEQARGEKTIDHKGDIYAVGAMLYRCVSGKVPYPGRNYNQIIAKVFANPPPPVRDINPSVPAPLAAVISKAMAREPEDRYDSAASFAADLAEIVNVSISISDSHNVRYRELTDSGREFGDNESTSGSESVGESKMSSSVRYGDSFLPVGRKNLTHQEDGVSIKEEGVGSTGGVGSDGSTSSVDSALSSMRGQSEKVGSSSGYGPRRIFRSGRWKIWSVLVSVVIVSSFLALYFFGGGGNSGESGGSFDGEGVSPQGDPLRVGIAQYIVPKERRAILSDLARYLEKELGRPIKLVAPVKVDGMAESLVKGELDILYISPLLYVKAKRENPAIEIFASVQWLKSRSYQGYILARNDSGIKTLKDLEGTRMCWVSKNSTSGYLFPRLILWRAGLNPETMFEEVFFTRYHRKALYQLDEGKCDVAVVYNTLYHKIIEAGELKSAIRIVTATGPIPQDAVVLSPKLPVELKRKIKSAFLGFDGETESSKKKSGGSVDGEIRINSFMTVDDSHYDTVRAALKAEKMVRLSKEGKSEDSGSSSGSGE